MRWGHGISILPALGGGDISINTYLQERFILKILDFFPREAKDKCQGGYWSFCLFPSFCFSLVVTDDDNGLEGTRGQEDIKCVIWSSF